MSTLVVRLHLLAVILALAALTGCKSTPKVDWNSRVGTYTCDQAVVELGPPDKSAKLTDGTLVAEWVISRTSGGGTTIIYGGGYGRRYSGFGVGQTFPSNESIRYQRLTFAPDGRLTAHERYWR